MIRTAVSENIVLATCQDKDSEIVKTPRKSKNTWLVFPGCYRLGSFILSLKHKHSKLLILGSGFSEKVIHFLQFWGKIGGYPLRMAIALDTF